MNIVQPNNTNYIRVLWLAVGLAVFTALAYRMIARGVLAVGDLQVAADGGAIVSIAAGCYLLGGLLILPRRRWLWIFGAVINAMVMLFFFTMYQGRPDVIFSPGGLATKVTQLLLEVALMYIIVIDWIRSRR